MPHTNPDTRAACRAVTKELSEMSQKAYFLTGQPWDQFQKWQALQLLQPPACKCSLAARRPARVTSWKITEIRDYGSKCISQDQTSYEVPINAGKTTEEAESARTPAAQTLQCGTSAAHTAPSRQRQTRAATAPGLAARLRPPNFRRWTAPSRAWLPAAPSCAHPYKASTT